MNAAFENSGNEMIFPQSPSIIATQQLYNDPAEFDRMFVILTVLIDHSNFARDC